MRKFVSLFSAAAIFAWILPLGAFIKPSQEKTACGGSRAFHMCSMEMSQPEKDPGPQKISFTNASGIDKTNKSANDSGGNDFIDSSTPAQIQDETSKLAKLDLILPRQLFSPVPVPIPKA